MFICRTLPTTGIKRLQFIFMKTFFSINIWNKTHTLSRECTGVCSALRYAFWLKTLCAALFLYNLSDNDILSEHSSGCHRQQRERVCLLNHSDSLCSSPSFYTLITEKRSQRYDRSLQTSPHSLKYQQRQRDIFVFFFILMV